MNVTQQLEARLGLDLNEKTSFVLFNPQGNSFEGGEDFLRNLRRLRQNQTQGDLLTMMTPETKLGLLLQSRWYSFKKFQPTYDITSVTNPADFTIRVDEKGEIIFGVPSQLIDSTSQNENLTYNDLNSNSLREYSRGGIYSILRRNLLIPSRCERIQPEYV